MLILGIDPGYHTGLATYIGGKLVHLDTIAPVEIAARIELARPARVVFEDSRLLSYTWTTIKSRPAALKMARSLTEGRLNLRCLRPMAWQRVRRFLSLCSGPTETQAMAMFASLR